MTARERTEDFIRRYYDAFNRGGDREGFLAMLAPTVEHDLNNAGREIGVPAFRAFMQRMDRCSYEQITDLVVFASESGARAAANGVSARRSCSAWRRVSARQARWRPCS